MFVATRTPAHGPFASSLALLVLFGFGTAYSQPTWISLGPAPIKTAATIGEYSGAVEAILADPTNPNRVFAGGVNGGIWRTTSATSQSPTWVPLTDKMPSLSIADIEFSPLDLGYNTLFAGIGEYSSTSMGGPLAGLLKSTDGGDTWTNLAQASLGGMQVRNVVPTAIIDQTTLQQVVLVAARFAGVFRSTDAGKTFILASGSNGLPFGDASHLVADPVNLRRFYAALPFQGVYRSDDGGVTWANITANLQSEVARGVNVLGHSSRIVLSVSPAGSQPVYAALIGRPTPDVGDAPFDIYRWDGTTWVGMGIEVGVNYPGGGNVDGGGSGGIHFAMLAHQTDPSVVFVAGDVGGVWRGTTAGIWDAVYGSSPATQDNTGPHADSRDMIYDANGNILESSDGGLARLVNPDSSQRYWRSVNGDLQLTEFYDVAYDSLNQVAFGGAQDNGCSQATDGGSTVWEEVLGGDGTMQAVDNSDPSVTSRYYTDHGNLGNDASYSTPYDGMVRRDYNAANGIVLNRHPNFADPSTPSVIDSGLKHGTKGGFVVNKARPSRLLLFGAGLYEGTINSNGDGDHGDTVNDITLAGQQDASAAAYGANSNPDVIYVGLNVNGAWGLYLRMSAAAAFQKLPFPNSSFPNERAVAIAIDPDNWKTIIAVNDSSQVYRSTDAGTTWSNITGNLIQLGVTTIESAEVFTLSHFPRESVLVGGIGGVFQTTSADQGSGTSWSVFGPNLPNTFVTSLNYYPATARANGDAGDVLVAGTRGRGAWIVANASTALFPGYCFASLPIIYADLSYTGPNPNGSPRSPFRTFGNAYNAAQDCNTIRIQSGSYQEGVFNNLSKRVRLETQGGIATIQ